MEGEGRRRVADNLPVCRLGIPPDEAVARERRERRGSDVATDEEILAFVIISFADFIMITPGQENGGDFRRLQLFTPKLFLLRLTLKHIRLDEFRVLVIGIFHFTQYGAR